MHTEACFPLLPLPLPTVKVQLNPYNRIRLMKIPIIQVWFPAVRSIKLLRAVIYQPQFAGNQAFACIMVVSSRFWRRDH